VCVQAQILKRSLWQAVWHARTSLDVSWREETSLWNGALDSNNAGSHERPMRTGLPDCQEAGVERSVLALEEW